MGPLQKIDSKKNIVETYWWILIASCAIPVPTGDVWTKAFSMEDSGQQYLQMTPPYSFTTPVYELATPSNAALNLVSNRSNPLAGQHVGRFVQQKEDVSWFIVLDQIKIVKVLLKKKSWNLCSLSSWYEPYLFQNFNPHELIKNCRYWRWMKASAGTCHTQKCY